MTGPQVVCYGELGVDNLIQVPFLPSPERAAFPTADSYRIGGAAANTAVWLAAWGVPVRLLGNTIGQDELGESLLKWLGAWPDLDLTYLERRPGQSTPFCRILITPDAERSILVFGYDRVAKLPLTAEVLAGAAFLALDLYGGEERLEAARLARRLGVPTVVSDVIQPDHPVLPLSDIVILSAAYLRSQQPEVDLEDCLRRLQAVSRGPVFATDGPRPVRLLDPAGEITLVGPPRVQPLDTTGAGDAFRAGLIYGLLQRWPLPDSAAFAAAAGALKTTRLGGASEVPAVEEVRAMAARVEVGTG